MASIKLSEVKKYNEAAGNGFQFDVSGYVMHGDKTLELDIEQENGNILEFTICYIAETEGEGWSAKRTGRHIPTLRAYNLVKGFTESCYHVNFLYDEVIGEAKTKKMFNYLLKLSNSIDMEPYKARALEMINPTETEEAPEPVEVDENSAIIEGMKFEDASGDVYTITKLDAMQVEFNSGARSLYDFGTSRTVGAVLHGLGNGAHLISAPQNAQTATETDETTTAEEEPANEPESTTETATDGEKEPLNPEELTGVFGEIVKGVEKLEEIASETPEQFAAKCEAKTAKIFPAEKTEAITADIMESVNAILDGADTSETIPPEEVPTEDETATGAATETQETESDTAPDMFAELAKAYFTGKTAPASRQKAKKETEPKNETAEAETTATADESEPEKPTAPPLKSDYGYTGEASDTFTTEEIDTLTSGGQVERIGKYDRRYIYISAKYNDRTALIYQTEANAGKIQPGKSLDYCGFITGGKFYRGDNNGIIESLQADINAAILQKLPTEEAAQANAEQTKGADSYNMRTAEELKQREYTEEARRKFCMGEEPQLKVYFNHYPESESAIIKYIEDPAQYIEERAAEYIEARPVEILKNYIIYNRTAPHYYNIAADPGNMAHQLKRMAAAVTDQKTLRIELTDGATIRAEASAIKYIGNRGKIYSCNYNLIDGERESRADIMPEEIKAIYHGQRTLYRAA